MATTRRDLILQFSKDTGSSKQAEVMLLDREGLITADYASWLEEMLAQKTEQLKIYERIERMERDRLCRKN